MSLQTNVTFKTIALFRTHDGERNTQSSRLDPRIITTV